MTSSELAQFSEHARPARIYMFPIKPYIEFLISYSRKHIMCITSGNLVVVLRHFYFGKETHIYFSCVWKNMSYALRGGEEVDIDIVPYGFFRFRLIRSRQYSADNTSKSIRSRATRSSKQPRVLRKWRWKNS